MRATVNASPFLQKDEVHELGEQLSKQPFNNIANKRLKKTRPLVTQSREMMSRFPSRDSSLDKNSIQLVEKQAKQRQASLSKVTELLHAARSNNNVRLNTFQTHFSSHSRERHINRMKMNQTIAVKRSQKSQAVSSKKSESSLELNNQTEQAGRDKAELMKAIEKEYNQGQLKEKHLMSWLNQILVEYCFQQPLEKGKLKALQRFGLDQTTLLSRGMTLQSSSRLYKMLFVYSMGFNNVLKQLGITRNTLKSIWKVYAILLQYCSAGDFKTIMGELQRDMMKNQQRLIKQIQKRQQQIDNNEQIIEERLHKYSKQNKDLTMRVKQLQQKNQVVQRQLRQMQIAYNMQVTLRLSYQYKINEIYSVHEKLNIVHLNMYRQLQEKTAESKKMAKQCWQAKKTAGELKADKQQITRYMNDLKNAINLHQNMIQGLRMNEHQLRDKLYAQQSVKREEVIEIREKQKKIGQLQRQVNSSNLMVNIMKSSADSHLQEYRRLMLQNSDLRRMNQNQLQKITELLSDIKFLNSKETNLKSELAHAEIKIKELQERLAVSCANSDDLSKQLQQKEVELRTKCIEYESQKKLADSIQRNMKEIKLLYDRMEEDNNFNKKYAAQMSKQYQQAHQKLMTIQLQVKAVNAQKFELQLDLSRKVGEIIVLRKKYESDADQQQRQYQKLHKLWSGQDDKQSNLAEKLATAQQQLQTANIRISFLSQKFTDLSFQKSKIQAIYNDNLVLHDKQKDAQKKLMIQISTLNQQLQSANRQIQVNSKTSKQQIDRITKEKSEIQKIMKKKELALKKKQGFVHPMLLQDALETLKREIQNHYSTKIRLENQVQKEQQKNSSLSLELQKKQANFRQHAKQLQRRAQKMHEEIQREREYFQGKSEQLNALIYDLQTKLNFKSMEVERKEQNSSDAKFSQLMKSKNQQIQQLLGQLQRIEDSYQQKCTHYQEEIQHIHSQKQTAIFNLKQSKKQLQMKVFDIQKSYQYKLQQKQKEKEAIVQKMLEQRAITQQPELEQERPVMKADKRNEFIARLKFANAYYHK